eukprot:CAMPEP_0171321778 /NCGR_PEP_ID=MMETSP0816-20121228/114536_1 /TAXON_ID=420281 /ORGANISM="Proboscia inermis, Strain CCAP1064/1" /LENGTH=63 /DNA_ID=CAMNT_0011820103 /DNA_START=24 /DNA_END=212 /DNA_ORIENTATION=-
MIAYNVSVHFNHNGTARLLLLAALNDDVSMGNDDDDIINRFKEVCAVTVKKTKEVLINDGSFN